MYCAKCGKEIPDTQVFCEECLAEMERYPVKPGTPIQLPPQSELRQRRQYVPKKESTPEEEIHFLKKMVQGLMITVTALMLLLCLAVTSLVHLHRISDNDEIGKNYHTTETTGTSETVKPSEGAKPAKPAKTK